MCSAQPVITEALMWSLGGTEASYYCCFMTTFALLPYDAPSFLSPLLLCLMHPLVLASIPLFLPPIPSSPISSKPTSISLAVAMGCLFVFSV